MQVEFFSGKFSANSEIFLQIFAKCTEFLQLSNISRNSGKILFIFGRKICDLSRFSAKKLQKSWKYEKNAKNHKNPICSGAKDCKSCRSRKMLQNAYLDAKIGFDTEENEPFNFNPAQGFNFHIRVTPVQRGLNHHHCAMHPHYACTLTTELLRTVLCVWVASSWDSYADSSSMKSLIDYYCCLG